MALPYPHFRISAGGIPRGRVAFFKDSLVSEKGTRGVGSHFQRFFEFLQKESLGGGISARGKVAFSKDSCISAGGKTEPRRSLPEVGWFFSAEVTN